MPFEEAADNPATQQYLDIVEAVDGKVALLGAQSVSAWLLFATSAKACDLENDLSRSCVLDTGRGITEWTGGGLHAANRPGRQRRRAVPPHDAGPGRRLRPVPPDEGFDCGGGDENVVAVGS